MDNTFDKMFYSRGKIIAGIDECGVQDIAGPLVAACVVLPFIDRREHNLNIFEVKDSKKVPERYRPRLAEFVRNTAVAIGIGVVEPVEIDCLGRLHSTRLAMTRAIFACSKPSTKTRIVPDFLLIDKIDKPLDVNIEQELIQGGDGKSLCIASASIIAKVYRDKIMHDLAKVYPGYEFENNKGHPCENQFKGIDKNGIIPGVHRTRFWPFLTNTRFPEKTDRKEWEKRRSAWKQTTEQRMVNELQAENN